MKRLVSIILIAIFTLPLFSCGDDNSISGDDWLLMQRASMDELTSFTATMDEVYTLYFTQEINKSDFKNELLILNNTLNIMRAQREEFKTKYDIIPESYSYAAKRGVDAVDALYLSLSDLLMGSVDELGEPKSVFDVSYIYTAYKEEITSYLADYIVAISWVADEYGIDLSQKDKEPEEYDADINAEEENTSNENEKDVIL